MPARRLNASSWREEYTTRYELSQKWTRSKIPTITHDPRVGNISGINADTALRRLEPASQPRKINDNPHGSAPSMISLSLQRGSASRSDPYNGKVAKGGVMDGAPSGFGWETVTAAAISEDGGCIVWGMANGAVNVSRTGLAGRFVHGQGQRASAAVPLSRTTDNHAGVVTAVTLLGGTEIAATCGSDAVVKLWDCTTGLLWSSSGKLNEGRSHDFAKLAIAQSSDRITLVCGTQLGAVHVWAVDAKKWKTVNYDTLSGSGSVKGLLVDTDSVLVLRENSEHFLRLGGTASNGIFGHHEGYISEITAIAADFQRVERVRATASISIDGKILSNEEVEAQSSLDFGRMPFVIAGDSQGRTFVWNWDDETDGLIKPLRRLQGFEAKVTAIGITEVAVLLGS